MCIRCSCENKKCPIKISFDFESKLFFFTDKDGKETSMYLDANTSISLINELKKYVVYLANEND